MFPLALGFMMGGLSFMQSQSEAQSLRLQGDYEAMQLETNKRLAEFSAQDAIERGNESVKQFKRQAEQVKGSQRASLAAQGIQVDSGTAAQLQDETDMISTEEIAKIKNNAWREAWGYKVEAQNNSSAAQWARQSAANASRNTLIAGGINAISSGLSTYGAFAKYGGGSSESLPDMGGTKVSSQSWSDYTKRSITA